MKAASGSHTPCASCGGAPPSRRGAVTAILGRRKARHPSRFSPARSALRIGPSTPNSSGPSTASMGLPSFRAAAPGPRSASIRRRRGGSESRRRVRCTRAPATRRRRSPRRRRARDRRAPRRGVLEESPGLLSRSERQDLGGGRHGFKTLHRGKYDTSRVNLKQRRRNRRNTTGAVEASARPEIKANGCALTRHGTSKGTGQGPPNTSIPRTRAAVGALRLELFTSKEHHEKARHLPPRARCPGGVPCARHQRHAHDRLRRPAGRRWAASAPPSRSTRPAWSRTRPA